MSRLFDKLVFDQCKPLKPRIVWKLVLVQTEPPRQCDWLLRPWGRLVLAVQNRIDI